jgi:hypothetical protein
MAIKYFNQSPRSTDTIIINIETPDVDGCFLSDPYKIDKIIIYYVERDFSSPNFGEYSKVVDDEQLATAVSLLKTQACNNPTNEQYALLLQEAESALVSKRVSTTYYFKDRKPVKVIGSEGEPAWLSTDESNSSLVHVTEDDNGETQYGHFTYEWRPEGSVRGGDYFVCWSWMPNQYGSKLSANLVFTLEDDPRITTAIPTHITPEEKYEVLLERYLPEMYKSTVSDVDLTPDVTFKLNKAVASGFTFLEDFANQIIDLFDANALHESLLVYLSNLFNLKLRSSDPTLWRRQIKEAIPLFKKKGTLDGLRQAFAQSGMILSQYTQYWQVTSSYTWAESFYVDPENPVFELEKDNIVAPIDDDNFGLWIRYSGDSEYTSVDENNVSFEIGNDFKLRMTWTGEQLSSGDIIKVLYQYKAIPNPTEQQIEDYIRSLPIQDNRDEAVQEFPPKNWNVKLIEEGDPLFDIIVPVRHPHHDPVIFGYLRTEFPYGENIYNMDEYNGSLRPSYDACFIDKTFIDPCGYCLSSSYSVDVGIEELSNDRILECYDILEEHMPFHSNLYTVNVYGEFNDFCTSPEEQIDFLVTFSLKQNVISGQNNLLFNRVMESGLQTWAINRDQLAEQTDIVTSETGLAYNNHVMFVVVDDILEYLGVMNGSNILEVLAPSPNAGTYILSDISSNTAKVTTDVNEPVDSNPFTFNLSNIVYSNRFTSITQDDYFEFSDVNVNFTETSIKTQWSVAEEGEGTPWKVLISAYSATPYEIKNIINNCLILEDNGTLPTNSVNSDISYVLISDEDVDILMSSTGLLRCTRRGYVDLNDSELINREQFIHSGDYLQYDDIEYRITDFDDACFWIADWTLGDVVGVAVNTRRRLLEDKMGYFGYYGLNLQTTTDFEDTLDIINGTYPPNSPKDSNNVVYLKGKDNFKESYLFKIDGQYFKILEWTSNTVSLSGLDQQWTTLGFGGTLVNYDLVHFTKNEVNVQFVVFDELDHNSRDIIISEIENTVDGSIAIEALSKSTGTGIQEAVGQDEGIILIIETLDGKTLKGAL